jgi:gamma-glutamyltranspeptidase/glutathione hydrolase
MKKWQKEADGEGAVTEDLVRYMAYAISAGADFLTDDPVWAEDFAPNGMCMFSKTPSATNIMAGKLVELGDTITRKRLAE